MSGKTRMLILVVLLLLFAGGAYLGWRHYLAAPTDSTAVEIEPVSDDAATPTEESPAESSVPAGAPDEANLPPVSPPSAPVSATAPQGRSGRTPQNLNSLIADIKSLHAACMEQRACTEAKWWDISVRLYAADAPVHLQELYAGVSRSWRSHLEAGPSADVDRELAIKLMNRAKEWGY